MVDKPALTEDQLAEIETRADTATPGPWNWTADSEDLLFLHQAGYFLKSSILWCVRTKANIECEYRGAWPESQNASFIAHARQDVPDLLDHIEAKDAEVETLNAEIVMLKAQLAEYCMTDPERLAAFHATLPASE